MIDAPVLVIDNKNSNKFKITVFDNPIWIYYIPNKGIS